MKVDEEATKEARRRQAEGVARMTEAFHVDPAFVDYLVPQDQRWLSKSKVSRRIYRRARMKLDPQWAARRATRKRRRQARRVNR